jgi:hypothetical protein
LAKGVTARHVSSFLAFLPCEAYSQSLPVMPEFEVVGVQPSKPGLAGTSTAFLPGGQVNRLNLTVKQLIVRRPEGGQYALS